jgi:hypothetical protein
MSLADVWPDAAEHSWNILRLYSKKHHVWSLHNHSIVTWCLGTQQLCKQ